MQNPCHFFFRLLLFFLILEICFSFFHLLGSVVGRIYNSSSYEDGDVVWTSPISKGTIEDNAEVATESGSRYFLAPQTGKEDEAAATKPTQEVITNSSSSSSSTEKEASSKPVLKQSPTRAVTPDNLYEVLQGISGAVHEMKEASLGLSAATENIASGLGGKITKKKKGQAIDVVLGAQWGDEGKGKLVDMLSQVSFFFSSMIIICFVL
jgi:hypothetical protein